MGRKNIYQEVAPEDAADMDMPKETPEEAPAAESLTAREAELISIIRDLHKEFGHSAGCRARVYEDESRCACWVSKVKHHL